MKTETIPFDTKKASGAIKLQTIVNTDDEFSAKIDEIARL